MPFTSPSKTSRPRWAWGVCALEGSWVERAEKVRGLTPPGLYLMAEAEVYAFEMRVLSLKSRLIRVGGGAGRGSFFLFSLRGEGGGLSPVSSNILCF